MLVKLAKFKILVHKTYFKNSTLNSSQIKARLLKHTQVKKEPSWNKAVAG